MGPRVGFIGLGSMGLPMAQAILNKGFTLYVTNRTREKADPLLNAGALWLPTPKEVANQCEILITMVANDQALSSIVNGPEGILSADKKPAIHLSMSTVSPDLCDSLEQSHQEKGITFLSAPVSGRPERAKQGALWVFLAGEEGAKQKAWKVLEAMSCKIYDLGKEPRKAALFKLCNNFMILSLVESFSQTCALLEKNGITIEKAVEVWGSSLFDAPVFHAYTSLFCKKNFSEGGFALNLGLKDMRLLHHCADTSSVPMPFLAQLHEKLLMSMNVGRGEFDWSAIALIAREQAGLDSSKS